MRESRHGLLATVVGVVLTIGAGTWVLARWQPPAPVGEGAAGNVFSAERALGHVRRLGESPRPLGSPAHAAARSYLVDELRSLGLESEVHEAVVVERQEPTRFLAVKVRNVVARLPGERSDGALLLAAHYDSTPNTAGAGDDLSGVATILETLRVLVDGPPLANDLIVLFSDGEELGLMGAKAFVDQHRWAGDVVMVLNFEARGNRGPSQMFETRAGNLDAIRALAEAVPYPYASSSTNEVYRRMPNDTDFSVFRDAGVQGLNMAFIGNLAAYHTRLDRPESLDLGSLQHQGSYALGLARHFGNNSLAPQADPGGADAVYFNAHPWRLVVYPAAAALPIALVGVALLLVGIALCRRRHGLQLTGIGRGLLFFVLTVAGSGAAGWCFWWFIHTYLLRLQFGPHGMPYDLAALLSSLLLLVAVLVGLLAGWFLAEGRGLEIWAGSWLGWALLGVALAVWVPGASYLAAWPLVGAGLGLLGAAVAAPGDASRNARPLIVALTALPAIVLLAPTLWMAAQALTLSASGILGAGVGLGLTPLGALLGRLHRASGSRVSTMLAFSGLVLLGWTAWTAEPTATKPAVDTLVYALDTETGFGWWASLDPAPDEWTAGVLGEAPERGPAPAAFSLPETRLLVAAAAPVALPPPVAELIDDSRAEGRKVGCRARSMRDAAVLRVRAESSVPFVAVSVEGQRYDFAGEADGLGEAWVTAYGFGAEGIRMAFELEGARPWPVEIDLVDQTWTFDALPEPPEPRPEYLIPGTSWRTDAVYVRASTLL